jgi:hypothetical protein
VCICDRENKSKQKSTLHVDRKIILKGQIYNSVCVSDCFIWIPWFDRKATIVKFLIIGLFSVPVFSLGPNIPLSSFYFHQEQAPDIARAICTYPNNS